MIFPPSCLLCESDQVGTGNVVVVADFTATHAGEKTLCGIGVDVVLTAEAVSLLMVDPVQLVTGMQVIP